MVTASEVVPDEAFFLAMQPPTETQRYNDRPAPARMCMGIHWQPQTTQISCWKGDLKVPYNPYCIRFEVPGLELKDLIPATTQRRTRQIVKDMTCEKLVRFSTGSLICTDPVQHLPFPFHFSHFISWYFIVQLYS